MTTTLNNPPRRIAVILRAGSATTIADHQLSVPATLEFEGVEVVTGTGPSWRLGADVVDSLIASGVQRVRLVTGEGNDREVVAAGYVEARSPWEGVGKDARCASSPTLSELTSTPLSNDMSNVELAVNSANAYRLFLIAD